MALSQPNGQAFYLTNGHDTPPLVFAVFGPSTRAWQYLVIDPNTQKGVIIDPVYDQSNTNERYSSHGKEDIIEMVQRQGYLIEHILETESSLQQPTRTAAWSLRMQLSNIQGYAPQYCSNSSVSALERTFARRYGGASRFSTTLNVQHADKERITVGRMRITVMHVPGFRTPNRRAYLVDGAIFGAYSIAIPRAEEPRSQSEGFAYVKEDEDLRVSWKSMNRVLALPTDTRVYYEEDFDGSGATNCITIEQCRAMNPYHGLNEDEFVIRRRGEMRSGENAVPPSSNGFKKNSKHSRWSG